MRARFSTRAALLCSTILVGGAVPPLLDDHAEERWLISHAYLDREPKLLRNCFTGQVFWVESEPDDWRALLAQYTADELISAAKHRLH